MAIKPAGHRVLVKPVKIEEIDKVYESAKRAGLVLNEDLSKREQAAVDRGWVLQIGETAFKDYGGADWCKVGDVIAYARYAGKAITDPEDNENYVVLNDEDVVAVISGI